MVYNEDDNLHFVVGYANEFYEFLYNLKHNAITNVLYLTECLENLHCYIWHNSATREIIVIINGEEFEIIEYEQRQQILAFMENVKQLQGEKI